MNIQKTGFCKEIIKVSGTILIHVTKENFEIINKLQNFSCTKISIGDYIVWDDEEDCGEVFSSSLKLKTRGKKGVGNYKLNSDKTKILGTRLRKGKLSYLKIDNEIELQTLNIFKCDNLEIGKIVVFLYPYEMFCYSVEEFTSNFKIAK